ncbi:DUF4397 domain-containing protein [Bacillus sp. FJAT-45037]|uniref:DUF4397 domain-containing protein n=1 Tax=Bacillus sp. FJAT-45037 TaxID=2011007 RepID=UPI000C249FC7|nr:DUF4397 domain-containing protein [Bacillus sp. FJAT-45037]
MKKVFGLALLLVMLLAFAGASVASEVAMVRVLHASPDAPAVDVYVNDDLVLDNVEYKMVSKYLTVPEGTHKVEIYPAGDSETVVITEQVTVSAGKAYTVAAIGHLESMRLTALADEKEVTDGNTKIRVAHFSPDAPAVDIATDTGDVLFPNAAFSAVTEYLELPEGQYNLQIRAAGTEDVVEELPELELKNGMVYTAVAVGLLNGEPEFDVILLMDAMRNPDDVPKTGLGGASSVQ